MTATIGRTLLKLDDGYGGIRMEWTDRDFLIQAADLDLGTQTITPQRGDQVKETVGSIVTTFEVAAYGNEPPWRQSDPFGIVLRIHTKLIQCPSDWKHPHERDLQRIQAGQRRCGDRPERR